MSGFTYTTGRGKARRDAGISQVSLGREAWLLEVRAYAREVAGRRGRVSINDLRIHFMLPLDSSPNLWGAVFRTKDFELFAFDFANHPAARARRVGVYRIS